MTRSRRSLRGHRDDDPVYMTRIDPDYEPQDRAKVDAALAHLGEVLNTLPGPVDGAVADLTTRDIATLLSRAPLDRRKHALGAIGIRVAPRTVGQALCADVRARLDRGHLHDVIHSGTVLTQSVRRDLRDAAAGHRSTEGDMPDPTAQWTEATLRFALWTGVLASPADARLLVWAATQPWFLPRTLSEAHGNEVIAAARAVVKATPDYRPSNARDRVTGPATAEPCTDHSDPTSADVGAEAGGLSESEEHMPTTTATDRLDDLRAEHANLEAALTSAQAAAHRLVETVDAGELPTAPDIDAITALRDILQHLAAELPLGAAAPSVATIDAALTALEQQARQSSVRARLEVLRTLDGGPTLADPLAALHSLVDDTLTRLADADAADTVAGLTALANLVDLIATDGPAQADPQRLMELQIRCATVLPPQLALLPVAALTGQLSWSTSAETISSDEAGPAAAPDALDVRPKPTTALGQAVLGDDSRPALAEMQRIPDSAPSEADTDDAAAYTAVVPAPPATGAATANPASSAAAPSVIAASESTEPSSPGTDVNVAATVSRPDRDPPLRLGRRPRRAGQDDRAPADGAAPVRAC